MGATSGDAFEELTEGEDCVPMRGDMLWSDSKCSATRSFVCKLCDQIPDPSACAFTGVPGEHKSMIAAELHCVNLGGHLASIHGNAQQAAMEAAAGQMRLVAFWIGFNDMDFESGSNGG